MKTIQKSTGKQMARGTVKRPEPIDLFKKGRPLDVLPYMERSLIKGSSSLPELEARIYLSDGIGWPEKTLVHLLYTCHGQIIGFTENVPITEYHFTVKTFWYGFRAGYEDSKGRVPLF